LVYVAGGAEWVEGESLGRGRTPVRIRWAAYSVGFVVMLSVQGGQAIAGDCADGVAPPPGAVAGDPLGGGSGSIVVVVADEASRVEVVGGPSQGVTVVAPAGSAVAIGGAGEPGAPGAPGK
jgi:hypothetical protein